MTINKKPMARQAVLMLCLLVATIGAKAQSAEKEIIDAMNNSAVVSGQLAVTKPF